MPIQPKPGHYYETRTGEVVAYMGPSTSDLSGLYPHLVGQLTYTEDGFFLGPAAPDDNDLAKDLGTTDPRKPKRPRKAPAKKTRKVRVWFVEIAQRGRDEPRLHTRSTKDGAEGTRASSIAYGLVCGPIFSRVIEVPLQKKKA